LSLQDPRHNNRNPTAAQKKPPRGATLLMSKVLANIELNEERFHALLTNLIGEARHLQNNPAQGNFSLLS
jgi:hypothetical protein